VTLSTSPGALSESVFVFRQSLLLASSFCIWSSATAKRDQSFICAYPPLLGPSRKIKFGNPPASKQQHSDASGESLSVAQSRDQQGPAGTRISRIRLPSHLYAAPGAHLAAPHRTLESPPSTVGPVAGPPAPGPSTAELVPAVVPPMARWHVGRPRLHPASKTNSRK